jgi:hypothetical protein
MDTELQRLKEAEHQAHALYERLRSLAAADPLFVETARRLWKEAADAVRRYETDTVNRGTPRR